MQRRTIVWLAGFAAMACVGSAEAQTESRPRTEGMSAAPATGRAKPAVRTASIPASPPAQPVVVNTTGLPMVTHPIANASGLPVMSTGGFPLATSNGLHTNYIPPAPVVQVTYYPTVVLADGRVLANFGTGRGYEQVLRQCPSAIPYGASVAACWNVDAYGNYRVMQQR